MAAQSSEFAGLSEDEKWAIAQALLPVVAGEEPEAIAGVMHLVNLMAPAIEAVIRQRGQLTDKSEQWGAVSDFQPPSGPVNPGFGADSSSAHRRNAQDRSP